jgi:hypothetical protein
MSEFSPLRDPVFLLTWQVHLAVVILFALLGIWAGMTRRPWYVAPTLFLSLLWLFVPLQAPEPVIILLLTVPVLAIACRIARRWLEPSKDELSESSPTRLRFSLRDLLWLMVLVGMLTALVVQVLRMPWKIEWRETLFAAACLGLLSMAALVATSPTAWKRSLLTSAILAALLIAAWFTGTPAAEKNWLLLIDWEVVPLSPASQKHLGWVYLLTTGEFLLFAGIGASAILQHSARPASRMSMRLRCLAIACFCPAVVGLGVTYIYMLDRPKAPAEQWPQLNERDAFWAVLDRHRQLNRQYGTRDELPLGKGPAAERAVADLLADLDQILQRRNVTQFDSRYDKPDHSTNLISVQAARGMARALTAQAKADWQAGRRNQAIVYDLRGLRLAEAFERRGLMLDAMVGTALEEMAMRRIADIRKDLNIGESQQVSDVLDELAADREPLDLLFERERYFADRARGWRGRLIAASSRILGKDEELDGRRRFLFVRRDALAALVRTDLAIRRYHRRYGLWPENLSALVPAELKAIPLDPFSDRPLIYRVAPDGFVLYSTCPDGADGGGKIADWEHRETMGYDLDLEKSFYFR